jgi:hypothetical protein
MTAIKTSIRSMSGDQVIVMVQGTITSVDKNTDTCVVTPLDGSADYQDVSLAAIDSADGTRSDVVCYPELNCFAVIGLMNNDPLDTFLIKASRYESVVVLLAKSYKITASGNGVVTIDATKITLNGGKNNGLVNITPLVTKITNLEKKVNSLLAAFKGHTHSGVTTGTHISGIPVAATPAVISPLTRVSDLEDTNITH